MAKVLSKVISTKAIEKIEKIAEQSINFLEKLEKYEKILGKEGFKVLDSGTNRVVFTHKKFNNMVFKIAIDNQGILDSLNEYEKADKSPYFPECYDIDTNGIILAQRRCPTISIDEFNKEKNRKKINKMLKELDKQGFVLIDLGADKHKNYGVDEKGNIRIIDFGYVAYKSVANFNCPHVRHGKHVGDKPKSCKGRLKYNEAYTKLRCNECDNIFPVDVVIEGYTITRYEDPYATNEKWKPSEELKKFYKEYNKHRDQEQLKRYVEVSRRERDRGEVDNEFTDTVERVSVPKPEITGAMGRILAMTMANSKVNNCEEERSDKEAKKRREKFNSRVREITEEEYEQIEREAEQRRAAMVEEVSGPPQVSDKTYVRTQRGTDVLMTNDEIQAHIVMEESEFTIEEAIDLLASDDSDEAKELIRQLFFNKFPDIESAIKRSIAEAKLRMQTDIEEAEREEIAADTIIEAAEAQADSKENLLIKRELEIEQREAEVAVKETQLNKLQSDLEFRLAGLESKINSIENLEKNLGEWEKELEEKEKTIDLRLEELQSAKSSMTVSEINIKEEETQTYNTGDPELDTKLNILHKYGAKMEVDPIHVYESMLGGDKKIVIEYDHDAIDNTEMIVVLKMQTDPLTCNTFEINLSKHAQMLRQWQPDHETSTNFIIKDMNPTAAEHFDGDYEAAYWDDEADEDPESSVEE